MRRLVYIIVLLLPPVGFVLSLGEVRRMLDAGQSVPGLLLMFGSLVVMTLLEALLFRFLVLPRWGQAVSERLYAGTYTPDDDPVVMLAKQICTQKDRSLLPRLEKMVRQDARRLRGWQELAHVYLDEFADAKAAVRCMREGAAYVRPAEDKAFLLYRAAKVCENQLHDAAQAQDLYALAARRYPRTAYGKLAKARNDAMTAPQARPSHARGVQ